ncbi:MAG: formylmethanofuran dehydrogenase subunit C [Methanosaeta sp. NSP1]|nr:MAG: formylmethanofuran dehydrogenase subunit C [Methanosaeta sp. NSP1]
MLSEIILRSREKIGIMIEAEVIKPESLAGKSKEEIEGLLLWQGSERLPLSRFFDVELKGSPSSSPEETHILMQGDFSRVKRIGEGMKAGSMEIDGPAGMHLGAEMAGGSILVKGDAGSWSGREMKGGWRGMTGGQIVIEGNARSQLGGGLVGGQITVGGDVENFCGIRQSGGLILVKGSAVRGVGAEMNGGTIAVCQHILQPSPGFMEMAREESPKAGEVQLEGRYVKFSGDYALSKNPKGTLYCREV